jgi:sialic acid synthase SpsE
VKQIKLGKSTIGDESPVFIIAEMAWSHDGSAAKAKAIIKGAAEAGADAISVHITSLPDYMVKDYGRAAKHTISVGKRKEDIYTYLDRLNLKSKDWQMLFAYARGLGLAICAMPNDMPSLVFCRELKPDAYVIAAACFAEERMVKEIAREKKPVILRIGGATLDEIKKVVNLIQKQGTTDIILLHGIQLYPTKIEDTHLKLIPSLKAIFGLPVGLADHMAGDTEAALTLPVAALGFGANVIEKHLTHNRKLKGEDYISALDPATFKKLVSNIREIEKSFGSGSFRSLSAGELRYREVSRKRTVAARLIKKGKKITQDDITFKRANDGVYPDEAKSVIGRTASQDIMEDDPLTWNKLV